MNAPSAKHVFISYVKENAAEVDALCRALEASHIPYWRDRKDLGPGDSWKAKIREAISTGSLVFLACFSNESRVRTKSYMNEELTLAVEEVRQRAPGATWLIPVRFDDGPVPEWELGGGRTLNDINYADLFGDRYLVEMLGLITTINGLLGAPAPDAATTLAAVEMASAHDRVALVRRMTKEMVVDPARRIELDDLVKQETRRVLAALREDTATAMELPDGSDEDRVEFLVERALRYWTLTEPLCTSIQVAARWADTASLAPWSAAARAIADAGLQMDSGTTSLLGLRTLPALFLTATAAVASAAQGRWDALNLLIADVTVTTQYARNSPLLQEVNPWSAFQYVDWLPDILIRVDRESISAREAFRTRAQHPRLYTPISDWLLRLLTPVLEDQFTDERELIHAFERAEVLLGVISQDLSNQAAQVGQRDDGGSRWYGRATWSGRTAQSNLLETMQQEFISQGSSWPPLARGLFGCNEDRATMAFDSYRENFIEVSRRFRFR